MEEEEKIKVCAGSEVVLEETEEIGNWKEKKDTEPPQKKENRSRNRHRSRDKAV